MVKAHNRINWENYPSDATPLNESNLNKIDVAVDEIDNRVITLDVTKLDKTTAATMVKNVSFNEATGIFTITYLNGATITLDTKLEKLAVNFNWNAETQQLIIVLDDGTEQYVDLSALITVYEFLDSDTLAFSVDGNGKVTATIKSGSITEDMLQPNYLADIKVETATAQRYSKAASDDAKAAADSAIEAESYAHGETGARTGEDTDNAKYYYESSKKIYENFSSAGNVTGVKGNAESEYRAGNVNITPEDIGALPVMYASSLGIANDATLEDFATAVLALEQTTVRVLLWGNQTAYSTIWTEIQEKVGATRNTYGYLICDKTDPRCCYFTFKEYSTSKVWNWTYSTVNGVGMSDEVWGNIPIDAFDNMNDITLAESLGWKRATVGRGIWTDLSSDYVYTAMIPPSDFVSGDTYIVKLNNGSIHKVTGRTYESYIGVNNATILIGEDVATATASGITTDAVIGKKAWGTSASNGYVLDTGAPLVISTSADVVAWYCNISSSSTVKNGISDSSAITEKGQYALDATEKNASISGTLANQISALNNNLTWTRVDISLQSSNTAWSEVIVSAPEILTAKEFCLFDSANVHLTPIFPALTDGYIQYSNGVGASDPYCISGQFRVYSNGRIGYAPSRIGTAAKAPKFTYLYYR